MTSRVLELKFIADSASVERGMNRLKSSVVSLAKGFIALEVVNKAKDFLVDATKAAMKDEAAMALLKTQVDNSGVSWKANGEEIKANLEKMSLASGFMKDNLAAAFAKLITATHSSSEATNLLSTAEDVARARHIDLGAAAQLLVKVHNGNTGALKRLGIAVTTVTTNQDALRKRHDELIASGGHLTAAQKIQYKQQLENAKAMDKAATSVKALDDVHKAYAGSSEAYSNTTQGAVARMSAGWEEFKVKIGSVVLPVLGRLAGFLMENMPAAMEFVSSAVKAVTAFMQKVWAQWGDKILATAKFLFKTLGPVVRAGFDVIKTIFQVVGDVLTGKWGDAWDKIKSLPGKMFKYIGAALSAEIKILGRVATLIGSAIYNGIKGALSGLAGALAGIIKGSINALIGAANSGINVIVDHWPDIPGAPGPPIRRNPIPLLAKGGIVMQPTLAMIGEAGPEMVIPLSGAGAGGGMQFIFHQTPPDANPDLIAAAISWKLRTVTV